MRGQSLVVVPVDELPELDEAVPELPEDGVVADVPLAAAPLDAVPEFVPPDVDPAESVL